MPDIAFQVGWINKAGLGYASVLSITDAFPLYCCHAKRGDTIFVYAMVMATFEWDILFVFVGSSGYALFAFKSGMVWIKCP